MKPIASFTVLLISLFSFRVTLAQSSLKTAKVKVNGKCEMCKNHIEKSARSAGASSARWDQKTKFLQISYDPAVTNPVKIQSTIASTGYDTQDVKARDIKYQELDECCRYDRMKLNETKD